MPTVIDSLVVLLSLDPKNFTEGQKKAYESLQKTQQQVQKGSKEIDAWGKKADSAYTLARNGLLKFLTLLAGGKALKDFVIDTTNANAALSHLAENSGVGSKALGTWEEAVRLFGGSAEDAGKTVYNLEQEIQKFNATGESDTVALMQRQWHIFVGEGTTAIDVIKQLSKAMQGLPKEQQNYFLHRLGIDQGTINLIEQGGKAVDDYVEKARKVGQLNDEQIQSFRELQNSWTEFADALPYLAKIILADLTPFATMLLNGAAGAVELLNKGISWANSHSITGQSLEQSKHNEQYFHDQMVKQGVLPPDSQGAGDSSTFNLIKKLEGAKPNSVTPTGNPANPFAYGENQVTLGTAKQYDQDATAEKLLDPAYNDAIARKIEADLSKKFDGDKEAIAIGYNAGPGVASSYLRNNRNLEAAAQEMHLRPDAYAQVKGYLARERQYSGGGTTVNIAEVNVQTQATDANGMARDVRGALTQQLSGPGAVAKNANLGQQ